MDLNHINLPAFLVADLYHCSLIESNGAPVSFQEEEVSIGKHTMPDIIGTADWKYLGENRKNILIVVSYPDVVHLPDDDLHFLTGILQACKLSIGDVAISNFTNYTDKPYKEIISHFKSKHIFLFGLDPETFGLPMSFPHFQVQSFAGHSFLFSPELQKLENDKVLKSKLWVCLKRIFGI